VRLVEELLLVFAMAAVVAFYSWSWWSGRERPKVRPGRCRVLDLAAARRRKEGARSSGQARRR
jgi:hypothetical protein